MKKDMGVHKPKVSVIVPIYNVQDYLPKCLNSLINQTLKDIEIICINDGSTDDSLIILQNFAFQDKRIKVIDQENKGVSAARNAGLDIAKGEFVGFVDGDDWVDLNFYECLYNTAKLSNSDIVKGNLCIMYKNNNSLLTGRNEEIYKTIKDERSLCVKFYYEFSTAIYNNQLLKNSNIHFNDSTFAEDIDFLCAVTCKAKKYEQRDDVFYYYLQNNKSTTKNLNKKHLNDLLKMSYNMYGNILAANVNNETLYSFYKLRKKELESYFPLAKKLNYYDSYKKMTDEFLSLFKITKIKYYYFLGFKFLSIEEN